MSITGTTKSQMRYMENLALQARIAELEVENAKLKEQIVTWHKYPDEKPELNVKCLVMFDDGEPIIDSFDGFYWFDIEKTWVDRITHWAYLPEPPDTVCDAQIEKSATQADLPVSGATQAEVDNETAH